MSGRDADRAKRAWSQTAALGWGPSAGRDPRSEGAFYHASVSGPQRTACRVIPHKIGTPEYRAVLDIEDPYVYRHRPRLKIPKYLVHASGDQFFLPDNSRFYFKDLEGEKYIRYVPNARHNLGGSDARESLLTFYQSILANRPRPKFSWSKAADGSVRVEVTDRPTSVKLWQATNPKARDFRLDVIGAAYMSTTLTEESPGVYVASVLKPAEGFTAFFVELTYDSGFRNPWKFTSEVSVVPDILPFKWEDAKATYPLKQ